MSGIWAGRGLLRRLRGKEGEEGVALVIVVGTMLMLAALATVSLGYTMAGQKFARYDQDYAAAMSAAQSGVDDFISHLNRSDQYGDTIDCENEAWKGPMDPVKHPNSCGWNLNTEVGWLPVVTGDTDPRDGFFHYIVDTSQKRGNGVVVLDVTGRVNGVYRTVETAVTKGKSTDYVYYTDFESADPSNVQVYPNKAPNDKCGLHGWQNAAHWYEGRNSGGCQEIQFVNKDTLDGAVFSNDAVNSPNGVSFLKGFETANPTCKPVKNDPSPTHTTWNTCLRGTSTANFNGTMPSLEKPLYLQDNTADFATDPGCHYFGSTRLIFDQTGKVTVYNNASVNGGKKPVSIAPPGQDKPTCGQDATPEQLTNGLSIDVPDNMVIYADTVAGTSRQCYGGEIGGPTSTTKLPLGTFSSTTPATPTSAGQSYTYDSNMAETLKWCNQGNLYAEGVVKGRVTIAAAQSVVVTGDLVLAGGLNGQDMLGLVATNSVEVFHPQMVTVNAATTQTCVGNWPYQTCTTAVSGWASPSAERDVNTATDNTVTWPRRYKAPTDAANTPTTGIQIAGSIQTLEHSFLVQKYKNGSSLGTLLVNGSIAQRWRGIVGVSSGDGTTVTSGYVKLYKYDTRLIYTAPPYFPPWVNSEFTQRYAGEIKTPAGIKG